MNVLLLFLVLFNAISRTVSTSNGQHIIVSGSDGTTLEQNPSESDPSQIHIHAKNQNGANGVTIRVHPRDENGQQYNDEPINPQDNIVKRTNPIGLHVHSCQQEVDKMIAAKRERNEMALHLQSLEFKLNRVEHANHVLHNQLSTCQHQLLSATEVHTNFDEENTDHHHHSTITNTIPETQERDMTDSNRKEYIKESSSEENENEPESKENENEPESKENDNEPKSKENDLKDEIKPEVATKEVDTKEGKQTAQWNKWSILIFALLFLIPIVVGIVFFCISQNKNGIKNQNNAFIVDEPEKKNSVEKELPFVLNEPPRSNHYSRQSTKTDIHRLSQNMDGYFRNSNISTKPVISESKDNIEEEKDVKPVISSVDKPKRQSLVDQQISSASDDAM